MTPAISMTIGPEVILHRASVNPAPTREQRLGFGFLVSQGVLAGILLGFVFLLIAAVAKPVVLFYLYVTAAINVIASLYFGIGEGIGVWLGSLLYRRRMGFLLRTIVGGFSGYLLIMPLFLALTDSWSFVALLWAGLYGWLVAFIAALPFQYWRILIRNVGTSSLLANVIGGVTGFVLRLVVIAAFTNSLLLVLDALRSQYSEINIVDSSLLLGQFIIAFFAVMLRLKLIPLVILSAIANAPVVLWFYSTSIDLYTILVAAYLTTWGIYILSHTNLMPAALQFLYEEFRYYLIDDN